MKGECAGHSLCCCHGCPTGSSALAAPSGLCCPYSHQAVLPAAWASPFGGSLLSSGRHCLLPGPGESLRVGPTSPQRLLWCSLGPVLQDSVLGKGRRGGHSLLGTWVKDERLPAWHTPKQSPVLSCLCSVWRGGWHAGVLSHGCFCQVGLWPAIVDPSGSQIGGPGRQLGCVTGSF